MNPLQNCNTAGTRRAKIAFLYLGRSPAFSGFVVELAEAIDDRADIDALFIVADHTELCRQLTTAGVAVEPVETFYRRNLAHVALGFVGARRRILRLLADVKPAAVVTLMPHIWSPLLTPQIKRLGIPYATIVHDAEPHPGDPTARVTRWLVKDASHADIVFTLSRTVAAQLSAKRALANTKFVQLFHPDLTSGGRGAKRKRDPAAPFRLLFFGRIMAYKGLSVLIDAIRLARSQGVDIHLSVAGAGNLDSMVANLKEIRAEVINKWLAAEEVKALLSRHDAMACAHVEASQSGVAALAFGCAMPVIAMPVGGIAEQVIDGQTGVLARDISAPALAEAITRIVTEPGLYEHINANLIETASTRSMDRFVEEMTSAFSLPAARP